MKIFSNVIASVAKQSTITRLIFALVFACIFAACGDDSSSSSVSPEPVDSSSDTEVSSSSVTSADSKSSSSSSEDAPESSSSKYDFVFNTFAEAFNTTCDKSREGKIALARYAEDSELVCTHDEYLDKWGWLAPSSSSAAEESSSSSGIASNSSSSRNDEKSSSSKVDDSSASVKPESSSTVTSSAAVASSSSVAEQSSSSRNWQPFNLADYGDKYEEFTDERNGRTYKYLKFEGIDTLRKAATIYAMVENLNVGEMVRGYKDQKDDSKIERYCYENDTLNCHYYGGLYQWAEMMNLPFECNSRSCADSIKPNHQGICPDGWRLLTYNDFYIIVNSNGNTHGVEGVRSTFGFGGYNSTGYSLVGTGYNWDYSFERMNESTYWHYPQEGSLGDNTSFVGYQGRTSTRIGSQSTYKTHGFSVRCVMIE